MPITLNGDTGILTPMYNGAISSNAVTPVVGMKNKIINGAMVIDQRNAGASVTPAVSYTLDRWQGVNTQASKFTVQQNAGSVTPPAGFTNYLGVTSSSAYSVLTGDTFYIVQYVEGLNCIDLAWGTANAKTVTLSFQVYSSLTGTFGGSLANSAGNRAYPFSYTVSSANTWTTVSVTIAGDTTGTWLTTNGIGIQVRFGLGSGSTYTGTAGAWGTANATQSTGSVSVVGTNGATFYITGVQLEVGSTATSFDYRPYGTELQLCQRYYQTYTQPPLRGVISASNEAGRMAMILPVVMRTTPTAVVGAFNVYDGGTSAGAVSSAAGSYSDPFQVEFDLSLTNSSYVVGRAAVVYQNGSASMTLSAEL